MRSGMIEYSTSFKEVTPVIVITEEPAPSIFAPALLRKFARSTISGSLAQFSSVVIPSAKTAAIITFSVPPTVGKSK